MTSSSIPGQGDNRWAVDPITASVIQGALESIAVEMGYKLMRMAYSSIIRESEDFGAAIVDVQCRQLCESKQSTPLQSGPIPGYIKGINRTLEARGEKIMPGDVIMHNDPYGGSSHGPDVLFAVPVFFDDKLVGWSATTAHHLDIGSLSPGSCGIVDAMDVYAEGLQFKAIKVFDQGRKNEMVWHMLRDNIRASHLVVADMEAQIAASRIGAQRFITLIERYGLEIVSAASEALMDASEKMMRNAISDISDGVYTATGHIDGFENSEDPKEKNLPIVVTVTVAGSDMTVDLTGTADQINLPINMPFEGTVDVAIWLTVRSILADTATVGHVPQNSGLTRPIKIIAPKGSLANPNFPAPVIARFAPGVMIADTLMRALAPAVPKQISAGVGNLKVIAFSGLEQGRHWVHMEIFEGAYGGRYGKDGMDAVDTLYANTRNNPIEDIESHLPLRVDRYEMREGVVPAGKWRGGIGAIREFSFLGDGGYSVEGEGHLFKPWGFEGGQEGDPASLRFDRHDGKSEDLPSKLPYRVAKTGDTFVAYGPCGGGYGDPLARDPLDVLDDVLDGYIGAEAAKADYGVVIANSVVDDAATSKLRASLTSA
ncbi:MAG: hydantoinase B/oxoprolinase family protein [Proteobacteria bacterium]|nr:hydantoinase B/oxoprolinase family protein [Pseudomonadota bacterium]MDA1057111.1 hydantoinase B/oxoprolinase family protein [Pseudomonadota bacterium]